MLVLSRKLGESVIVELNGETVVIKLLQINGSRVRIGLDAPKEVAIHREELLDQLIAEGPELRSELAPL